MIAQQLIAWQKAFREGPKVYLTEQYFEGSWEPTGNLYDSREGAQLEVGRYPKRRLRIVTYNIHTKELSRQRWLNNFES